jgi:hypothetical protein
VKKVAEVMEDTRVKEDKEDTEDKEVKEVGEVKDGAGRCYLQ